MTRYFPNSKVPFTTEFRNNGVLTDVPQITFTWKVTSRGLETTVTPTHPSTGVYAVVVVPSQAGNLYARWDTEGTFDVVAEPVINIKESAFQL